MHIASHVYRTWQTVSATSLKERPRTMRFRLLSLALALSLASTLIAAPLAANAAPRTTSSLTQPVTGTIANGGTFAGALNITRFAVQNGQLVAIGTLTGTLTNAAGQVIGSVS